jgi:ATP-binding cassette, subfamily F, member 3
MLTVDNLTYRIAGRVILDGASCFVPAGHKAGLVGRNGSGKTTLFGLITGALEPETGSISLPRLTRIGKVAQEAPAGPRTLLETVLDAHTELARLQGARDRASDPHEIAEIETRLADIGAHSAPARAAEILAGLGFGPEEIKRPCADFSGGWRMRVALAAVLFTEPDLLLLDEPTNYLDLEGSLWLEGFLERYPHTVLLISHDRHLLNRAVGSILHLERGKLTYYTGGFDRFQELRRQKLDLLKAESRKVDTQRKHLQKFVDRFRYKESKARQAQSKLKALQKLTPIVIPDDERIAPIVLPKAEPLSPPILAFDGVSCGYGDLTVLSRLNLRIDHDDRIALLGKNGNGKSTFAKLITQRLAPQGGTVTRSPKLKTGYFAQHQTDELDPEGTPRDHMAELMPGKLEREVRARLGFFGFGADKADTKVGLLSGGEKARLLLSLAAFHAPQLIVLDEPTNHLDIEAREALITAINDYEGAIILISHDRTLVETCAERLWLVADGKVTPFEGDLDDYEAYVLGRAGLPGAIATDRFPLAADVAPSRADERRAAAEKRASLGPLKRKADQAEKAAAMQSSEIGRLESALADPKLYARDPAQVTALTRKLADARKALATAEASWLAALEEYESAKSEV